MSQPATSTPSDEALPPEASAAIRQRESRNMLTLALYDITFRIGWVFKTESVIIPAFLDIVAGPGWVRGLLPVANRFGQSVPPTFFAGRLRQMPLKKHALAAWTLGMAVILLVMAAAWWLLYESPPAWMALFFLVLYSLFFACYGLYMLSFGTLQGKLIRISRRGRFMAMSLPAGSVLSITCAALLLGRWLDLGLVGYCYLFAFTGCVFLVSAGVAMSVAEPPLGSESPADEHDRPLHGVLGVLRGDANFRVLMVVAMLAAAGPLLFPHYQALARERLQLGGSSLMVFVVTQNAAVGAFGLLLGWIIDRSGHRMGLRVAMFIMATAPLVALGVAALGPQRGQSLYWLTFLPLGMTPISMRTFIGYTLDASPQHAHPRYLSTLSLCLALPFCFSPLVGWLIDTVGFDRVFFAGALLIAAGGLLTFRITEPRHHQHGLLEAPLPPFD